MNIRKMMALGMFGKAAANPWYKSGGILSANVVAVYQPLGAVSKSASYKNLINPGIYDADLGVAPVWDKNQGWIFDGSTMYLTTGITPPNDQTWSAVASFKNSVGNASTYFFGSTNSGMTPAFIFTGRPTLAVYGSGDVQVVSSITFSDGIISISGAKGYRNGTVETGSIATKAGTFNPLFIGATNVGSGHAGAFGGYCLQALAIYNKVLTDEEELAIYKSLHAMVINDTPYQFTKYASNPIISGYFGSAWYNGAGDYVFYYTDGTNVLRATSANGLAWTPDGANNPVMTPASGITDVVSMWKESSTWYMLYRSTEWGTGAKIGLATSANGITWAKNAGNPVISPAVGSWEAGGTGIDPAGIMKIGATYYLWMNNVGIIPRQTGLLTSTDLVNWSRDANNPIFTGGRYCTAPIKHGTYYYMFVPYTPAGSPVTYPLNGRIEVYRDTNPTFYAADRSYLGYVLLAGAQGAWDSTYLDTPSILTTDITRDTTPTGTTIQMYYSGRVSVSTFTTGLATGTFSELEKLVPQVCPE